jgi:hypothetical protein
LKFGQNFTTAFKPRELALSALAADNGVTGTGVDLTSVTGFYSIGGSSVANASESGLFVNFGGTLTSAGLATSGTRLKAVFANLDANATYYVSLSPVANFSTGNTVPAGGPGDTTTVPYAVLLTSSAGATAETIAYAAQAASGAGPANPGPVPAVQVAPLTVTKGAAEAVWEVTNFKQSSADTYAFALYAVYPSTKPPTIGSPTTATVALSYAPTNGTASTSPVGVTTVWVPRFSTVGAANTYISVLPCQTTLLFPFVTNLSVTASAHWETGIAIENTGLDPLQTVGQTGSCALNFYGANAPPTMTVPTSGAGIAPGAGYTFILSNPANASPPPAYSSFTGYMFAVCNFNYGHGFAFITDNTNQLSEGYLALILSSLPADAPTRGTFTLGETLEN